MILLTISAALITGCKGNPSKSTACGGTNFDEVRLQPGCSTICAQEPCRVYFDMPAGEGSYVVRGRAVTIGEYPAGKTVFFGSFWEGFHRFTVEGTDAPPAYLSVGGGGEGVGNFGN